MSCHSRAANFVLGLSELQINRQHDYGGVRVNQLHAFQRMGLFKSGPPRPYGEPSQLVDPYDESADLEARARSYLHVNCSGCHVEAGGGNARMELELTKDREAMRVIAAHPQHDTLGVERALLIAPGQPDRSLLYQRVSRRGRGQMPPLVSNVVDARAARVIHDWIQSMESQQKFVRDWKAEDLSTGLNRLGEGRSREAGRAAYRELGCNQCHRLAGEGGGAGPDLSDVARRLQPPALLESILLPSKDVAADYATTIVQTSDGRVVQGRVEQETDADIVLRTSDPFAQPIRLSKSQIEDRQLARQSIMPSGMLNALEEDRILDLLAYLLGDAAP
jgi:putative heme-binding domain-containing protein